MCSIQVALKTQQQMVAASSNSQQLAAAATVATVSIAAEVVAVGSSNKQQLLPVNWINLTNKSQVFNNLPMQQIPQYPVLC